MLKPLMIAACLALPFAAVAQDKKMTPQQERMASCNKDAGAKNLKGDERKQFMSECLSSAKASQQDKMKTCNKEANDKGLTAANKKGDDRKKFMSECLKA